MNANRPRGRTAISAVVLSLVFLLCNCSASNNALVEGPPTYQPSPTSVAPQVKMPDLLAPKLVEVQEAVHRVFKDSAVIDTSIKPSFVIGDFNGDASQDLAVVLRPAPGKLSEINEEYPAWLLRDPLSPNPQSTSALSVDEHEVLLAIIHGYSDNNWRDSQATQTFLLKNMVGSNISVQSGAEFLKSNSGRQLPRPQGDLIGQKLHGMNGYLYYARANYAWYDPKTFKPAAEVGMVHRR